MPLVGWSFPRHKRRAATKHVKRLVSRPPSWAVPRTPPGGTVRRPPPAWADENRAPPILVRLTGFRCERFGEPVAWRLRCGGGAVADAGDGGAALAERGDAELVAGGVDSGGDRLGRHRAVVVDQRVEAADRPQRGGFQPGAGDEGFDLLALQSLNLFGEPVTVGFGLPQLFAPAGGLGVGRLILLLPVTVVGAGVVGVVLDAGCGGAGVGCWGVVAHW